MSFSSWRGTVGLIKPTMRPGSMEETVRLLPDGIGLIPIHQNVRAGTVDEFEAAIQGYHDHALTLAAAGVDMIHHSGTPPFMMQGYKGEAALIRKWEREMGVPHFTANQNIVRAFKALGAKKIIGVSYSKLQNNLTIAYMSQAGFDVLAMEPLEVPFEKAGEISPHAVYSLVRETFLKHPKAEVIYLQGNAWRLLSIVERMERDFGIPVIETGCALSWEIQQRFSVREPREGCGRLLREMP
jgi:maleate cis-trans isomerase